ncbi:hypothetical protein [Natronorubrum sp. DTA28]|uniref:hypothetical protein n=1 Tax=Natronorubrum sp. DTA28 TaxID=3447019 RepID=UPI003F86804B
MSQTHARLIHQYDAPSWVVTVVGALFGIIGIAYVYTHPVSMSLWAVEFALVGAPAALIVYGGYWVATRPLTRSDRWSVAVWGLVGGSIVGAVIAGYIVVERLVGGTVVEPGELLLLGVSSGMVVSLYASIVTERQHLATDLGTIESDRLAEVTSEPLSEDARELAELALDTRSWNLLYVLSLAEKPLAVETLVDRVAVVAREDETDVYVDTIHVRIPKLEEKGLIHYESDTEVVRPADRLERVANAGDELSLVGGPLASALDA